MSFISAVAAAVKTAVKYTIKFIREVVGGILRLRPVIERVDETEPQLSPQERLIEQQRDRTAGRDASIIKRYAAAALADRPAPSDISTMSARARIWLQSLDQHEIHVLSESRLTDIRDHLRRKRAIDGVRSIPRVIEVSPGIAPSMQSPAEIAQQDRDIAEGIRAGTIVSPREFEERQALLDVIKDRAALADRIRARRGEGPEPRGKKNVG